MVAGIWEESVKTLNIPQDADKERIPGAGVGVGVGVAVGTGTVHDPPVQTCPAGQSDEEEQIEQLQDVLFEQEALRQVLDTPTLQNPVWHWEEERQKSLQAFCFQQILPLK